MVVLAIYCVFLTDSGWLKIVCGLYLVLFFVLLIISAFQSTEPEFYLSVTVLLALVVLFAYNLRKKWKDWP